MTNTRFENGSIVFTPDFYPTTILKETIPTQAKYRRNSWYLPPYVSSLITLEKLFPGQIEMDSDCQAMIDSPYGFPDRHFSDLDDRLMYFQGEAVSFLASSPHPGSLLGLSPGLGKTLTSIEAARVIGAERVLVVCPLSLIKNWEDELQQWSNFTSTRAHGVAPSISGWTITNYETVANLKDVYDEKWDLVIVDESLIVKNHQAKRTKALTEIASRATKTWLLSGSPTSKYADDLFGQFKLIDPASFTSYWRFARAVCYLEETHWGIRVSGDRRDVDVHDLFRDIYFVRHQEQVLELPEFVFNTIDVDLEGEQLRIYLELQDYLIALLENGEEMSVTTKVAQIVRLQQVLSTPRCFGPEWPEESGKLDALVELIQQGIDLPILIWVHWHEAGLLLERVLREKFSNLSVGLVTGSTPLAEREQLLSQYKTNQLDVLILSTSIGKYGHTLVNTRSIIRYDRTFNADAYLQSLARVRRKGLLHRPTLYTIRVPGTVDDLVEENLRGKFQSIARVSNGGLLDLLRSLGT